jgi:filamentous hemagglutinin family protein
MRLNLKLLIVFLVLGLNLKLSANEISNNTLPTDPNVTYGTAEISQGANQLTIDQQTDKLITNWSEFNIGSDAKVQFNQPSSNSSALNHVNSADPSYIYGSLDANGKVILINPNGVIFSKGSRVDVGAIVASSLKLSDENFLKDNFVFEKDGIAGMVENRGTIKAFEGGTVALISSIVKNNGTIETPNGSTALLAGEKITLNLNYNQLISYTIDSGVLNGLVENNNAIVANNGQVILSARGLDAVRKSVVNNDGIIEAKGINTEGGKIFLEGDEITVKSNSTLNASGDNGGGQILVGGSWQNSDPTIYQATTTTIEEGATLNASANNTGNGGEIVVWSDITNDQSITKVQGKLTAEGGKNSGNGGQIETSGYKLDVEGIEVSTLANDGSAGEWLLDPESITISTSGGTTLPNGTNSGNITISQSKYNINRARK